MPDASVVLHRDVFIGEHGERLFASLFNDVPWEQHLVQVYGRTLAAPRLSAWYGDPGSVYSYSGVRLHPLPWTPTLFEIKSTVDELAGTRFNSALLNLYRNGQDSVGWHSDAEPELGRNPLIASVSLGAVRRFLLQHKKRRNRVSLELEPGSVLIMDGTTQHHWRHQLPKTRRLVGARINVTFRKIR
ncbi:MAG: alpha-ketoglutarate-dependent dioxygenase AlkB [Acidiferrobacterales bacterium]